MTAPFVAVCDSHDRETWLSYRATGIGASEIAGVLGASSWESPLTIYRGKVEPPPHRDDEEWMQWGLLLEPAIRAELGRRAGVTFDESRSGMMLRSTAHPWATATPDEVTVDGEPCEVKNLAWGYDPEEWEEGIPEKYRLQCQHQLLVTGASRCLFGALLHGQRLVWEWIERDEETIRRITIAGAEMWRRIQEHDEPPSDGHPRDRATLARGEHDDDAVEVSRIDADPLIEEYLDAREAKALADAAAKTAERRLDAAKNQIAQLLGKAKAGRTYDGWSFAWKVTERKGYEVKPATITSFQIKEPKGEK